MSGRSRVVLLVRSLAIGGAERQAAVLAAGLVRRGVDVTVVCFYGGGPLEAELTAAGVRVVAGEKRHRWDVVGGVVRVGRLVAAARPDVVYAFLPGPDLVALAASPFVGRPMVVWGVRSTTVDPGYEDRFVRVVNRLEAVLSRQVPLVIANSRAGAADARARGMRADRVRVVPNGIDTVRFAPDAGSGAAMRREWGVPASAVVVGAVGRLHPMKDHATFLRAAALVAGDRPDAWFVVVGDDERGLRDDLVGLARALGIGDRTIVAPAVRDAPAVFRALDVLASSSCYGEGFPNVVAEAMACATPCVVTDVGDSALVVGEQGRVVPPGRPDLLAAALTALLADDLAAVGAASRQAIRERFSVEAMVDATADLLGLATTAPERAGGA